MPQIAIAQIALPSRSRKHREDVIFQITCESLCIAKKEMEETDEEEIMRDELAV
ncbi:hypothetical protein NQZ68_002903 [Dissostichus eleginoides]|nr:hypothetical protein NQZ68_002903 [Dissostichus eleginoides]